MKIIYLGQFNNPFSDTTEKHIKKAFEMLEHQVIPIDETYFHQERNRILEEIYYENADLFFFHKGGWRYKMTPEQLVEFLTYVTIPKVFWWFDKISDKTPEALPDGRYVLREHWMDLILSYVDYGFVTDGTFVRRHKYKNLYVLRQGVGDEFVNYKGQFRPEFARDIVFLGRVYGGRGEWIADLKKEFGDRFEVFNNVFGRNLKDCLKSCKITLSPLYPANEFYWSSRFYQMVGNGGFLIHPRLEGLKEEGWIDGKHYVGYRTYPEMYEKINYYLEHEKEREKIRKQGYEFCIKNFKYSDRVKELLEKINL